jgi:hypothetical protein
VSQADLAAAVGYPSLQAVSALDACAVKRSDGQFKYGQVQCREAAAVVILVDESSGSTKTFSTLQAVDPGLLRKLVQRRGGAINRLPRGY